MDSPTSPDEFNVAVVGVSYYQEALKNICGNKCDEGVELFFQAKIVPYDDNPYDAHAVRIEICGETVGHLSRTNARVWRSKMIEDNHSGIMKCPAKIVWDRSHVTEGSYGLRLDLDLTLSDSKRETNITQTASVSDNQSNHIEFLVNQLNIFELSHCKLGDKVDLWQKGDTKEIFIYRQGTDFGQGKIGICPDAACDVLLAAAGWGDVSIVSIYEDGCKINCRLLSKAEMEERIKPFKAMERKRRQDLKRDLITPVDYSVIDSDIYKCFISNQTGMCDFIGTWEQFREIEERIARLCQKNNGRYYKSKAKTAKFAIIFAPNARTYSNVTSLMKMGYKVTTFEKALEYFGLSELWDCKKIVQHEYDLKKFDYEDTFHKAFPLSKKEI